MKALSTTVDLARGLVRLVGVGVPNGDVLITRQVDRMPEPIRGGDFTSLTGGFILTDPEPPFGVDLLYRATVTPVNRNIQTNRVLNPKAALNTTNWTVGTGRTLTRDAAPVPAIPRDATTALQIGPNTAGATGPRLSERTLASALPLGFGTGRWFVSGQMKYDSPDTWLWMDARSNGTWQAVKNKGTWQTVKSAYPLEADQPFASLWCAVLGPTTVAAETRRNRVPNPQVSVATTSWFVVAGTGGTAAITRVATGGPTNGPFARSTYTVANTTAAGTGSTAAVIVDGRGSAALPIPVTAGQAYSAAVQSRSSIAQLLDCRIQWYDASNVALTGAATQTAGNAVAVTANTWTRLTVENAIAPAGAAYARVAVFAPSGVGAVPFPIGGTLDATLAQLEQATTIGAYFDGDTAASTGVAYTWAGTANASQSIQTVTDYPVIGAPFQILGVSTLSQGNWRTFQGWVDVPAGAPAGSRLVFLHGTAAREFATTFWLTTVMVTPEAEMTAGAVTYFDGDSALPANPAANMVPGYDWFAVTTDASMTWSGTPNASSSVFTGPSVIAAETTDHIGVPDKTLLPQHKLPVMLSDPIVPQVNVWFELVEIGDLGFAARQQLFDVIGRGPQIAVSSQRAWATGEFRLLTYTREASSVAERMFAPGRILFLRNPDPDFPETYWYLAIGDVTQGRVGTGAARMRERLWRVPFARVERPVGLIAAASGVSWQTVKSGYTWAELRQMRTDWLDTAVTTP